MFWLPTEYQRNNVMVLQKMLIRSPESVSNTGGP